MNDPARLATSPNLERGRLMRAEMIQIQRQLKAGTVSAADVIADPPEAMQGCQVRLVLQAVPRVGSFRAHQICTAAGVKPWTPLRKLTVKQRFALMDRVPR